MEWGGTAVQRERNGRGKITQRTFEKVIGKHYFTFTKYMIYKIYKYIYLYVVYH